MLFPPTLIGKKLKKEKTGGLMELLTSKSQEQLEEYLNTKNPDFLFQSIREDNSILQAPGINLSMQAYGINNNTKN